MDPSPIIDNPFAVLTFLAAPAILTNGSAVLVLSTSNRLARAADRARAAAAIVLDSKDASDRTSANLLEFQLATRRAELLLVGLRRFYLAAGSFAGGTCVALLGSFAGYFHLPGVPLVTQVLTSCLVVLGVGALVAGSVTLVRETRLALNSLGNVHVQLTKWRADHASAPPTATP